MSGRVRIDGLQYFGNPIPRYLLLDLLISAKNFTHSKGKCPPPPPPMHPVPDTKRICIFSAASRNFEKGARSRTHFQKAGQPEYFWATHPFNAKHPFNIYLCITILQEAFISIVTNFLFLKNTFKNSKKLL